MKNNKNANRKEHSKNNKKLSSIDLLEKRIIYIDGSIDDELAKDVINKLLKLDLTNHKDIKMLINSDGGSVSSGLAIYDVMNAIKSDVSTVCVGRCASMAGILFINGAKGKRKILPNAEIMVHEVSSVSFGKVTEMQDKLTHSKTVNRRLLKIIVHKTNMTMHELMKETNRKDKWYNAHQAVKYGFADEILWSFIY